MSAEECPHGMGDPSWCSVCKHGVTKPEPAPTVEATFRARYDGVCPTCDDLIDAGSMVHKLSNDRYVHLGCQP